jgi:hypothetical protein
MLCARVLLVCVGDCYLCLHTMPISAMCVTCVLPHRLQLLATVKLQHVRVQYKLCDGVHARSHETGAAMALFSTTCFNLA